MHFIWSWALLLLTLVPLFAIAYVAAQRRRARFALRYSSLLTLRTATDRRRRWYRHIPAVLMLLGLTAMVLAMSRPYANIPLLQEKTVILTIDTSASMSYRDIQPSRMQAAKDAAHEFLAQQDSITRVGVVAFSHSAALIQAPTTDHQAVAQAIDQLAPDTSTAIGDGIIAALKAISEENGSNKEMRSAAGPTPASTPVPVQSSALIILLTDGQNTTGELPLDAAQQAAQEGVRVYTIGIGAPPGPFPNADPQKDLDEVTLQQIADMTHAQYFRAFDESALTIIYRNLGIQAARKMEPTELAPAFTALAVVFVLIGGTTAFRFFGGLP